jgi:hypothetical protein
MSRSAQGDVFRLRPPSRQDGRWGFTVLYTFTGQPDGAFPAAGLVSKGNGLFSTTESGGTGTCVYGGCGTVFEVEP